MENIRAYGAGLTSGQFDSNTFFKKPTVIFRTITLAFGVLLWFSISKGGWHRLNGSPHHQVCLYGNSASTCSFGSALGFFSVICAAALLISDAKFENISSIPTRKRVVTGDLTISDFLDMDRLRRSPSLDRFFNRRRSFDRPPVRNINSPKLTEEEADALTSPFLPYRTRYTYAFSKSYNADLPDSWEVPNLVNNQLEIASLSNESFLLNSSMTLPNQVLSSIVSALYFIVSWLYWLVKSIVINGPKNLLVLMYDIFVLIIYRVHDVYSDVTNYFDYNYSYWMNREISNSSITSKIISKVLIFKQIWARLLAVILLPLHSLYQMIQYFYRACIRICCKFGSITQKLNRNIEISSSNYMRDKYDADSKCLSHSASSSNEAITTGMSSDISRPHLRISPLNIIRRRKNEKEIYGLRSRLIMAELTDTDSEDDSVQRMKAITKPLGATPRPPRVILKKDLGLYKSACDVVDVTMHRIKKIWLLMRRLRRRKYLWLILPLFLMVLFISSKRNTYEHYTLMDYNVSEFTGKISSYASRVLGNEWANKMKYDSIYKKYWVTDKIPGIGVTGWLTKVVLNGSSSIWTRLKSIYYYIFPFSISQRWSSVVNGFYYIAVRPYNLIPSDLISQKVDFVKEWAYSAWLDFKDIVSSFYTYLYSKISVILVYWSTSESAEKMHVLPTREYSKPHDSELEPNLISDKRPSNDASLTANCPDPIDQEKLVQEISAKLAGEMDIKMKTLEKSYNKIIDDISSKRVSMEIDQLQLETLIRDAIYQYDADKTGLFDYALESAGASIISTRCSESYNTHSRLEKIWNIPLWYSSYGPRTVIQRNSKTLFPGECWSFKSGVGYLTIDLSHAINISSVSYEHIGRDQAPDGNRSSAPQLFKLWAYKSENDLSTRILLGTFEYKLDAHPLQFFVIKVQPEYPVKIIEMEVMSNYGAPYTCLYRLRVHGRLYKPYTSV